MFCACAAPASAAISAAAKRMIVFIVPSIFGYGILLRLHAQARERLGAPLPGIAPDLRIQAPALAVHGDDERAEAAHAEFPQRLGMQVVEIDVLDRLDPGGLERRGAPDNREIGAAKLRERLERAFPQAAFADDEAHAVLLHERAREPLHAIAGRGPDADRLVLRSD